MTIQYGLPQCFFDIHIDLHSHFVFHPVALCLLGVKTYCRLDRLMGTNYSSLLMYVCVYTSCGVTFFDRRGVIGEQQASLYHFQIVVFSKNYLSFKDVLQIEQIDEDKLFKQLDVCDMYVCILVVVSRSSTVEGLGEQ